MTGLCSTPNEKLIENTAIRRFAGIYVRNPSKSLQTESGIKEFRRFTFCETTFEKDFKFFSMDLTDLFYKL